MAIRFKCECGADLAVPDGNDTKAVLCSSCGKTVKVPDAANLENSAAPAAGNESPSALFRAAIAAFNDADSDGASPDKGRRVMDTSDKLLSIDEASGERPLHSKLSLSEDASANAKEPEAKSSPAEDGVKAEPAVEEEAAPIEDIPLAEVADDEDEIKFSASGKDGDKGAGESEAAAQVVPPGGPQTKDAMGTDIALAAIEARTLRKALNREGEPVSAASAYEPTDAEIHGEVIKFHCKCGKRISAPIKAKKSIGKCPKCGTRLALPKAASAKTPEQAQAKKKRADQRSANVKTATADAANRLRKSNTPLPKKAPPSAADMQASAEDASPKWTSRFVAFQADFFIIAGIFLATAFGLHAISPKPLGWIVGGVVAAAVWAVNRIVISALLGGSCGMLLAGLKMMREDGSAVGIGNAAARALLGALLIALAPLALNDPQGRTVADRIAGTRVVSSGN